MLLLRAICTENKAKAAEQHLQASDSDPTVNGVSI